MPNYILRFPLTAIADDGGEISYSDFNENEKKDLSSCMSLNLCFDPEINGDLTAFHSSSPVTGAEILIFLVVDIS